MAFSITQDIPLFAERGPMRVSTVTGGLFNGTFSAYEHHLQDAFDFNNPEIWGTGTTGPYAGLEDLFEIYYLEHVGAPGVPEHWAPFGLNWVSGTQVTGTRNYTDPFIEDTGLLVHPSFPTIIDAINTFSGTRFFPTSDLLGLRLWRQTGNNAFDPNSTDDVSTYNNTTISTTTVPGNIFGATGGNPDRTFVNFTSPIRFGGVGKIDDNNRSWNHGVRVVNGDLGALPSLSGQGVVLSYLNYGDFGTGSVASWTTELLHANSGPGIEGAPTAGNSAWYFNVQRHDRHDGTIDQSGAKYFVIHEGQRERIPATGGTNGTSAFFYSRVFLASWDVASGVWDFGNNVIAGTASSTEHYFPAHIIEHSGSLYVTLYRDETWHGSAEYGFQQSVYSMILSTAGAVLKDLTLASTRSVRPASNQFRIGKPFVSSVDGVESLHFAALHKNGTGGNESISEYVAPLGTASHTWTRKVIVDYTDNANFDKKITFGRAGTQDTPVFFLEKDGLLYAFWGPSTEETNPSTNIIRMHGGEIYFSTRGSGGSWSAPQAWRTGQAEGDWVYWAHTLGTGFDRNDWDFSRLTPGAKHYRHPIPFEQNGNIYVYGCSYNAWDLYIASDPSGDPALRDFYWPVILATSAAARHWGRIW